MAAPPLAQRYQTRRHIHQNRKISINSTGMSSGIPRGKVSVYLFYNRTSRVITNLFLVSGRRTKLMFRLSEHREAGRGDQRLSLSFYTLLATILFTSSRLIFNTLDYELD